WGHNGGPCASSFQAHLDDLRRAIQNEWNITMGTLNDVDAFGVAELSSHWNTHHQSLTNVLVVAMGTGVGDVLIEDGAIDFNRPHQASQAIIRLGDCQTDNPDHPCSLADFLRRSRWEALAR